MYQADAAMSKRKKPAGTWGITIRILRVFILLVLLLFVGMGTWLTKLRTTDWDRPLRVVVYPIDGDNSTASSNYIDLLEEETFQPIEDFMEQEAEHCELKLRNPVTIKLAPKVNEIPPKPTQGGNLFNVIWWSLKLRYWAYRVDTYEGPAADIRMFVVYFNPKAFERLSDSLGLQKGLIGVVYAYASRKLAAKDNVIIAHELLHTVGATDKYDFTTRQPIHPDGYANPDRQPLFPQEMAEIMGCRIPLSETKSGMPEILEDTVVGVKTAKEIKWIRS